jgi:hypothetical protein
VGDPATLICAGTPQGRLVSLSQPIGGLRFASFVGQHGQHDKPSFLRISIEFSRIAQPVADKVIRSGPLNIRSYFIVEQERDMPHIVSVANLEPVDFNS